MRVIIAGSRNLNDYAYVSEIINDYEDQITEVVCGEARGVDSIGRAWAEARGIPVASFPADWDGFGKRAGYLRNVEMADYADALLAIWDGESKGTKHMIDIATDKGLIVWIEEE